MKRYKILWSVLLLVGITSCSHFLDVTPKNVISMDDMESIKKSMAGFIYNITNDYSGINGNTMPWSPFLDNWNSLRPYSMEWDLSKYAEDEFTDSEIEICDWRNKSNQSLWSSYYSPIGFVNLIIHEAATAEGEEDMRDYVMGEAYVMRAYCFFKLLQHFAPYKDNQLGIPVCLETYEDFESLSLKRSTQTEVYAQILSDLHEAEIRLERTPSRETFNLMYTTSVMNRLFAEVYHFKALSGGAEANDWKNAAIYAEKETKKYELVSVPATLKNLLMPKYKPGNSNSECALLAYTGRGKFGNSIRSFGVNQAFYQEYFPDGEGDIRQEIFYDNQKRFDKFSSYSGDYDARNYYYVHFGFRLAETFLIQAEALTMSGQLAQARDILQRFKEARYTAAFTLPNTQEDLLKDIYRERRKEFVGEMDIPWLDMKRLGDTVEREIGGITFNLNGEGDFRYAFPIPEFEIKNNKEISQNPGWILND